MKRYCSGNTRAPETFRRSFSSPKWSIKSFDVNDSNWILCVGLGREYAVNRCLSGLGRTGNTSPSAGSTNGRVPRLTKLVEVLFGMNMSLLGRDRTLPCSPPSRRSSSDILRLTLLG